MASEGLRRVILAGSRCPARVAVARILRSHCNGSSEFIAPDSHHYSPVHRPYCFYYEATIYVSRSNVTWNMARDRYLNPTRGAHILDSSAPSPATSSKYLSWPRASKEHPG